MRLGSRHILSFQTHNMAVCIGLQLAVRGHNVALKEYEGIKEEELKKCKLGGAPFDESRLWHMDMSDTPTPCEVSAMYMVQPAPGGIDDTLFAR